METDKIIHRVSKILEHYRLSMNAFDIQLGLGNNYIGSMIRRQGNIGSDVVEKIVRHFPEISPEWFVTGEGDMFRDKNENNTLNDPETGYYQDQFEKALLQYLDKPKIKEKLKKILNDGEGEKNNR